MHRWLGLGGAFLGIALAIACSDGDGVGPGGTSSGTAPIDGGGGGTSGGQGTSSSSGSTSSGGPDGGDAGSDSGVPLRRTLVRARNEDSDPNCLEGYRIERGADADDDGVLDAAEVASTEPLCPPMTGKILYGNYTVSNSIELDALAGYIRIVGNLQITANSLPTVDLPDLVFVDGQLSISGNSAMTSVRFPALRSARTFSAQNNPKLVSLDAPNLVYGGSTLQLNTNVELASIALPRLASPDRLELTGMPALTNLMLPALGSRLDEVLVRGTGFASLSVFAGIERIDDSLSISTNAQLTDVGLPSVRRFGTSISINGNQALTSLAGLDLTGFSGAISIASNNALTDIGALDALVQTTSVRISESPGLTSIVLANLTTTDFLDLLDNGAVGSISLPKLTTATQRFGVRNGSANGGAPIATLPSSVSAPLLVTTTEFEIMNTGVTSLAGFAGLRTVSNQLTIRDNRQLDTCLAQALLAQLTTKPPNFASNRAILGNANPGAVCP